MFCPQCGNELLDGAKFCPMCGIPINLPAPNEHASGTEPPAEPPVAEPPASPDAPMAELPADAVVQEAPEPPATEEASQAFPSAAMPEPAPTFQQPPDAPQPPLDAPLPQQPVQEPQTQQAYTAPQQPFQGQPAAAPLPQQPPVQPQPATEPQAPFGAPDPQRPQPPFGAQPQSQGPVPPGTGYAAGTQQPYGAQQPHGTQQPYGQPYQQVPTQPIGMPGSTGPETWNPITPPNEQVMACAKARGIGMKWYLVVVWLELTIGLLATGWTGIQTITGLVYGGDADLVYAFYPSLRFVNIIYGLACFALIAARLYTRKRMVNFRTDGPRLFLLTLLASGAVFVVYSLLVSIIAGSSIFDPTTIITVICIAVEYVLSKTYFDKRADLFVY